MRSTLITLIALTSLLLSSSNLVGKHHIGVEPLIEAARAFLDSLDEAQRKTAQLPFNTPDREDWHYFPKQRKGLAWADMKGKQEALSWAIFHVALSNSGVTKAEGIVDAERILWERSNRSDRRDPKKYNVTIFGEPAPGASWGASLEGHHLSINLTVIDGKKVAVTPSFFGSNPDHINEGEHAGFHPLKGEAEEALKLFQMLDPTQRSKAVIGKMPREIITRAERQVEPLPIEGLPAREMSESQRDQLRRLLAEYIDRYRAHYAHDDWAKIDAAGIEAVYFVWSGDGKLGKPMYYRLQGPTFLMEYANVQTSGNHSHTVWRDFENDFGRDLLREHLDAAH